MHSLMSGLSVVLPCFNRRADVAESIRTAIRAAARISDEYEVIVVDDGSTDGTAAVACRFARGDRRVRVIVHPGHEGYGAALRSGINAAGKQWVLLTDGDLRIDLDSLDDFLPAARRSDLVVGWRIMRRDPVEERARVAAWSRLVTRLFELPVHDVNCALKLVRRDLFDRVELTAPDAMVGTELAVKCVAAGGHVSEVAFREAQRDPAHTAPVPGLGRSLAELAELYRPLRALRRGRGGWAPQGVTRPAPRAPRATPG
jgi:glycosyltransferase involved in cell wall biosynthesis